MYPKISIITITYNSEQTLQRTIDSIINQHYQNLEYIIVDGGSKDKTIDIVKNNEKQIAKWISEPDKGISDAFNKGIRMATGDLVGLINSDDQLEVGALSLLANVYSDDIDVYCGDLLLWNETTGEKHVVIPSLHFSFNGMSNICHPATFIRKEAYEKYGMYDVSCKYAMDCDLLMRFERAGAKIVHIDNVLACFSLGGVTFTRFTKERLDEIERVYRNNGASNLDIFKYKVVRKSKNLLIRIFGRDRMTTLKQGCHKNKE